MNLTTIANTNVKGNAWKQIKSRSLLAIGGVALAATIVITGSSLAGQSSTAGGASIPTTSQATVAPMFATAVDAEYAARSLMPDTFR